MAKRLKAMGTPGYVVRGKGVARSLNSASHGAGRRMSRTKAKELFSTPQVRDALVAAGESAQRHGGLRTAGGARGLDEAQPQRPELAALGPLSRADRLIGPSQQVLRLGQERPLPAAHAECAVQQRARRVESGAPKTLTPTTLSLILGAPYEYFAPT